MCISGTWVEGTAEISGDVATQQNWEGFPKYVRWTKGLLNPPIHQSEWLQY